MRNVSPTKIGTFDDCKRKFVLKYVYEVKEEQTEEKRRGEDVHKVAERSLLSGEPPPNDPIGRMALAYLEHLPPMREGIAVELPFALETFPGGPPLHGKIDHIDIPQAVVTDLKTAKRSFFFARTPMELLRDPQMVSYAVEAHRLNPGAREITVRHVYVIAESKRPIPPTDVVPVVFDPRRLLLEWRAVVGRVAEMHALAVARPDPLTVEPTPSACRKYGGCPYRQICGYADDKPLGGFQMTQQLEEMRRMQMQNGNGVPPGYYLPDGFQLAPAGPYGPAMSRLGDGQLFPLPLAQQAPQAAAPLPSNVVPIAPPAPPPAALPAGYVAGGTNHLVPHGYYVPAGFTPMDPNEHGPRMVDGNGRVFQQPRAEMAPASFPVIPPGFAPPMPPVQPLPPIAPVSQQATVPIQPAPPPAQVQIQPPPPALPATGAAPVAGPGRGRKKKDAAVESPAAAAIAPASALTATAAVAPIEEAFPKYTLEDAAAPLELWIDVLARKGGPDATTLEDWMQPALDRARQLAGGVDWRSVDYEKGKGYLFQALAERVKSFPPSGVLLVRSAMAGADVAIEVLTPRAARVCEAAVGSGGRR